MNPALALGDGDALHAVHPGFELQIFISVDAAQGKSDFLKAADFIGAFAYQLDLIIMDFGPAGIHAVQLTGKQARLVTPGRRPDFKDDIALIIGVLRRQFGNQFFIVELNFSV